MPLRVPSSLRLQSCPEPPMELDHTPSCICAQAWLLSPTLLIARCQGKVTPSWDSGGTWSSGSGDQELAHLPAGRSALTPNPSCAVSSHRPVQGQLTGAGAVG